MTASVPGIETFTGRMIFSDRWDHDDDLTGKRVAVIGTGACIVQILPELVRQAERVTVFQRTPVPVARLQLRVQVRDPWLRRQLTPTHRSGRTRPLVSADYYPALQRDNCKLITWPIATVSPRGVRTADGVEHQVDCIVFATQYVRQMAQLRLPDHEAVS